ncbi:MAG: hypothetical protein Q3960_01340 [Lactobacillus sp.]|nr:hypothetical protein [Lactobacillus sp.]
MTTISQKNLLKLALEAKEKEQTEQAISLLEEAIMLGPDTTIALNLSQLYQEVGLFYNAYELLKNQDNYLTEPIFTEYLHVLKALNLRIEFLQLKELLQGAARNQLEKIEVKATDDPLSVMKLKKIQVDNYWKILTLDLPQFELFVQEKLASTETDLALHISLIEECVKLQLTTPLNTLVLDKLVQFVPKEVGLFQTNNFVTEVNNFGFELVEKAKSPSLSPLFFAMTRIILGSLYPIIDQYLDDPKSFAQEIFDYITGQTNVEHSELITKILQKNQQ